MRTVWDAFFLLIALGLLGAMGLVAGCSLNSDNSLAMPFLEVDRGPAIQPSRPAQSRPMRPVRRVQTSRAPNGWDVAGKREWRYVVIHHSATEVGSAGMFDRIHREQRGWDELGYHFVITNGRGARDGLVQVGSRWRKQKWGAHCGGTPGNEYNEHGIGICLVGDFTSHMPTSAQMASLHRLLRFLVDRYDIPPQNIIAHREAPNAATACCGDKLVGHLQHSLRPSLRRDVASRDR